VALMARPIDAAPMTTTTVPQAYGLQPGEGRRLWVVGDTMTFKATTETTGGSLMAVEVLAGPGGGPPPHVHANEDEFWFVLEGEFEIMLGAETIRATPGSFAFAPRGTRHSFRNAMDTPSRVLIMFTPGGFEGFFFEAGLPVVDGEAAPPLGPQEIERSRASAIRHGMDVEWPGDAPA
jgi:quercetin dioxygenase-like cupin family protein